MMRLIDADTLMAVVEGNPLTTYSLKEYVRCTVSEQPTVDAVPVRHGKWVPKYIKICGQDWASGMKCSECGEDALNAEGNEFLTDYCPNCGARMDEDANN